MVGFFFAHQPFTEYEFTLDGVRYELSLTESRPRLEIRIRFEMYEFLRSTVLECEAYGANSNVARKSIELHFNPGDGKNHSVAM